MRWLQQDSSQSPGKSEFQRTGALSFACFCCVGTAGLLLRGSLVAAKEANLYLTKVVCLRRHDWIDQPLRCNAASQIRASRGETRPAFDGHERTWKRPCGAANRLGASASEVQSERPIFQRNFSLPTSPPRICAHLRRQADPPDPRSGPKLELLANQHHHPPLPVPSLLRSIARGSSRSPRSSGLRLCFCSCWRLKEAGLYFVPAAQHACWKRGGKAGGASFSQALAPPAPPGHAAAVGGCGPSLG